MQVTVFSGFHSIEQITFHDVRHLSLHQSAASTSYLKNVLYSTGGIKSDTATLTQMILLDANKLNWSQALMFCQYQEPKRDAAFLM